MLSFEQVGAAAMLSRATAGVFSGKIVFSTPGSPPLYNWPGKSLLPLKLNIWSGK